jgi:hypothetical protein
MVLFEHGCTVSVDKTAIYVDFDLNFKWGTRKARKVESKKS